MLQNIIKKINALRPSNQLSTQTDMQAIIDNTKAATVDECLAIIVDEMRAEWSNNTNLLQKILDARTTFKAPEDEVH